MRPFCGYVPAASEETGVAGGWVVPAAGGTPEYSPKRVESQTPACKKPPQTSERRDRPAELLRSPARGERTNPPASAIAQEVRRVLGGAGVEVGMFVA